MDDLVRQYTSLPNLHPALVHFPLALLPAALLFDLAGLFLRRRDWLARAAAVLWAAGALGAGAAYWAGREAADHLAAVAPRAEVALASHSDWALYALWTWGVLAACRLVLAYVEETKRFRWAVVSRALLLVPGAAGMAILLYTADLGGALVYRHGLGARAAAPAGTSLVPPALREPAPDAASDTASLAERGDPPASRLARGEDGSLSWRPLPGDGAALGTVLSLAPGGDPGAVEVLPDSGTGGEGLALRVEGKAMLVLPGTFGSVRVEATLLPSPGFEGTVGLAHHVRTQETAGLFEISTDGRGALAALRDGKRRELDGERVALPEGTMTLAVSAAGRHLKGMLEGKTVVHGHTPPGEDGGCGLYLEGRGVVRILSVNVVPLEGYH